VNLVQLLLIRFLHLEVHKLTLQDFDEVTNEHHAVALNGVIVELVPVTVLARRLVVAWVATPLCEIVGDADAPTIFSDFWLFHYSSF
jgi:hypothetical protein